MQIFRNRKKLDNKGFSLVELIVVVMIIAILAVSLAPQVMKWTTNARISADINTVNEAVSAAQVAMTNREAYKAVNTAGTYTIRIDSNGLKIYPTGTASGATAAAAGDKFYDAMKAHLGSNVDFGKIKITSAAAYVYITVTTGGIEAKEYSSTVGGAILKDSDGEPSSITETQTAWAPGT